MSEKRKVPTPNRIVFSPGDRVTYIGAKTRYLNAVGTVFKVKTDGCHIQFDDDPVLATGGIKTSLISVKELRLLISPD